MRVRRLRKVEDRGHMVKHPESCFTASICMIDTQEICMKELLTWRMG